MIDKGSHNELKERCSLYKEILEDEENILESGIKADVDLGNGIVLHLPIQANDVDEYEEDIEEGIEMCNLVPYSDNDYEARFQFIKRHSDNPDDLKLAREIIGLDP